MRASYIEESEGIVRTVEAESRQAILDEVARLLDYAHITEVRGPTGTVYFACDGKGAHLATLRIHGQ